MALQEQHGVDFIIDTLRREPSGSVTLVPIGPLTNIAEAFRTAPEIVGRVQEIVLMGGAYFEVGNITPAAEFNIYVDPEAADIVFRSGINLVVVPHLPVPVSETSEASWTFIHGLLAKAALAVALCLSPKPARQRLGVRIQLADALPGRILRCHLAVGKVLPDRVPRQPGTPRDLSYRQLVTAVPASNHTQQIHVYHSCSTPAGHRREQGYTWVSFGCKYPELVVQFWMQINTRWGL